MTKHMTAMSGRALRLRVGMGTLITVALALAIGGYQVYQQRQAAAQPPIVTREVRGSTAGGIAPVPEFLLRHGQELALTPAQTKQIERIAAGYRSDIAPTKQRLETAAAKYQKYLERQDGKARPQLHEVEAHGEELQRLSQTAAITRQSYWRQANAVLTKSQRRQVAELIPRAVAQDLQ